MVIRMRHTRAHTKNRRSHHALTAPTLSVCKNCGAEHRPHHMCLQCGFYKGRQVMDLAGQKAKRDARMQAKKDVISSQAESIAPSEAEAVSAAPTVETKEEK
ncbi:MAG: large subunit ribosomal protein L32 [Acidimicrobiales bacterium]|jgi:large subunit ribosomal protein L32